MFTSKFKWAIIVCGYIILNVNIYANPPECSRWASNMAFTHLKNANITNNKKIDFDKTKTTLLVTEKIDKDLFRQIYYIEFTEKSGNNIKIITLHDASSEECSMSNVDVYIVSEKIGGK